MKIGLRTLKTVLAVFISAVVVKYVLHDSPFFACIGALVAVERTIPSSIQASLSRNIGTIVGGVVAIAIAHIAPSDSLTDMLLISLGLVPMIYISVKLNRKDSIVAGGIVYFAVSYLNPSASHAIEYGSRRILGTLVGSLIGLLVNCLFFKPEETTKNIKRQ